MPERERKEEGGGGGNYRYLLSPSPLSPPPHGEQHNAVLVTGEEEFAELSEISHWRHQIIGQPG